MTLIRMQILFFLTLVASVQAAPMGTSISGSVVQVVDGNTLDVMTEADAKFRIIMQGIDCPELAQPFGMEAKSFLEQWLLGRVVIVHLNGKDRSGNYIGVVLLEDNQDVRLSLLGSGLAWTSEKDPEPELEAIRLEAAAERKGLWNQKDPAPPWIYRREQSMFVPKSR